MKKLAGLNFFINTAAIFGLTVLWFKVSLKMFYKISRFIFSDLFEAKDEEMIWENHVFESALEKADDLCEMGYMFQKNEIIYKKISEKSWLAEILLPDACPFEQGHEFTIENYSYKKIGKKTWTIERLD